MTIIENNSLLKKIYFELKETYRFRYVTLTTVQNNLKLRYRRSILGFFWTVLAPMMHYLVIGLVFSLIMSQKKENYFVFYFSGAIFFAIISGIINRAPMIFIQNEHFIKKIYVPKFIFILNAVSIELANFLLSTTALIFIGITLGYFSPTLSSLISFFAIPLVALFLTGLACIISVLSVYFRDFSHIVPVAVQATFFITPVIYDETMIPANYHLIMKLNPFYYYLQLFRLPLLEGNTPSINLYLLTSLISISTFVAGLIVIKIFDNKIVFKL